MSTFSNTDWDQAEQRGCYGRFGFIVLGWTGEKTVKNLRGATCAAAALQYPDGAGLPAAVLSVLSRGVRKKSGSVEEDVGVFVWEKGKVTM